MHAVSLKNVRFEYEKSKPVLEVDSFHILTGEKVFLYGPSGSGKTTLLGLITGILKANQGEVSVLGTSLNSLSARERDSFRAKNIGYIFQQFNLIPYLTVQENIELPVWNNSDRADAMKSKDEAFVLADALGLKDCFHSLVSRLSVGQQQRAAVARALIGSPKLVIADEPTSALDEDRQKDFLKVLMTAGDILKPTLLFVSHNRHLESAFDRSVSLSEFNRSAL